MADEMRWARHRRELVALRGMEQFLAEQFCDLLEAAPHLEKRISSMYDLAIKYGEESLRVQAEHDALRAVDGARAQSVLKSSIEAKILVGGGTL